MKYWWINLVTVLIVLAGSGEAQLAENFYRSTCPNVEAIVQQAVSTKFSQTFVTIPATLRLFFHDCFVEGCDASVLIASPNGDAEKDSSDNISLAGDGFDTVVQAKQAVEAQCPGVVSCADILALAARDVVVLTGGPAFNVELGRRDGLVSQASRVAGNLPEPNFNLNQLTSMFAKHGLSLTDLIALSGAHTLGFSHCDRFSDRIYSSPVDPTLDSDYVNQLKGMCPRDVDPSIAINMDPETPRTFDNVYYQNLVAGKGLFTSDQVLFTNSQSQPTVTDFANNPGDFNGAFITAMRKLGRVGRAGGQLVEGFYESSCPNVEDIVKKAVTAKYMETNISGPAILRAFFHDCFVEGCDASILIASANGDSERDAEANLSLRREGFDTVNRSKIAVENECPGVVSCADILALAARDAVVLTGGPTFDVELGRHDGLISQASRVAENIPDSFFNLYQLKTIFDKKS
ncbi:hypothetical protein FEM48_Zijuj09G0221600 [Ziziphus jujuba var. spinosa]|uniref:peroxidase n=1 Tax=Ziziphus jujuba var. spinosa TaxID=714518 RepID=A0A978UVL3_ZIZJJ|nr:hypothetical protein FEM48_Zijuj09G0221600 [Ziziphus jujuba var. spinosa]